MNWWLPAWAHFAFRLEICVDLSITAGPLPLSADQHKPTPSECPPVATKAVVLSYSVPRSGLVREGHGGERRKCCAQNKRACD